MYVTITAHFENIDDVKSNKSAKMRAIGEDDEKFISTSGIALKAHC